MALKTNLQLSTAIITLQSSLLLHWCSLINYRSLYPWDSGFASGLQCHMEMAVQGKGCLQLPTQGAPEREWLRAAQKHGWSRKMSRAGWPKRMSHMAEAWWGFYKGSCLVMIDFPWFLLSLTQGHWGPRKINTRSNWLRCAPHIVSGHHLTNLTYCRSLPAPNQVTRYKGSYLHALAI